MTAVLSSCSVPLVERSTVLERRRPVRVLHIIPSLHPGGMEKALVRLIRGMAGQEDMEHGICILRDADTALLAECQSLARIWTLAASETGSASWTCWRRVGRVIRRFRPDIVHARSTGAWFDAAAAHYGQRHSRLILSFHGQVNMDRPGLRKRMINRWSTGRAHAVLSVSHESARMMNREWHVPADKLHVMHNGVDVNRFQPAAAEHIHEQRERLGLSMRHRVVICVANLVPIKAIDVLLQAWVKVQANDEGARLLLIGEGPLGEELTRLGQALGCDRSVRFLGRRDDVADLLRAADISVLPSRYEACSNAILESMAVGVPMIACNVGGNSELIENGKTGWLIHPDSPAELSACIVRNLLDDAGRVQAAGAAREAAVESFGMKNWIEAYSRFYLSVAGRSARLQSATEGDACAE